MKFTISWWDNSQGLGVAVSEDGRECLIHRSEISKLQASKLQSQQIIFGEIRVLSKQIAIIEKIRLSKNNLPKIIFENIEEEDKIKCA